MQLLAHHGVIEDDFTGEPNSLLLLCITCKGRILLSSEEIDVDLVSRSHHFLIYSVENVVQILEFVLDALLIVDGARRSGLRPLFNITKGYLLSASSTTWLLMMHHSPEYVGLLGRHLTRRGTGSGGSRQNLRLGSIKGM